jgi:hypothetical protein
MRWIVLFAALLFAVSALPVLAAEPDEGGASPAGEEALQLGQAPDAKDISEALGQVESEERAHEEWLETGPAEKEREDSELSFSGLSVGDSKSLLTEVFAAQLEALNGDPGRILSDSQLLEPLGDSGAVIREDGDEALVETTVPVRAEDEGRLQKVDLSLEETPEGFETDNAVSDLVLPVKADEPIQVGDEGFEISQSNAADTVASPLGDKNVFYPSLLPDTDLLVAGTTLGAELFDLLRSKGSPEDLMFDISLPAGSELRPGKFGGAEVVRGEERLIRIPPPTALDAQGTTVPVEMEVQSESISLHVDHHNEDFAYPILVDPIVEDWVNQGNNWYGGANWGSLSNGAWTWESNNSGFEKSTCCWEGAYAGLLIKAKANAFFGPEQYLHWIYRTGNPNVIIPHIWLIPFNRWDGNCGSTQPHDYVGLWTQATGWDPKPPWANYAKNFGTISADGRGEALMIGMSSGPPGVWIGCDRVLYAGGVGIWLDDEDLPVLTTAGSTKWMDATPLRLNVSATDPGVGVRFFEAYATDTSGATQGWTTTRSCTGLYGSRCPATWNLGETSQPVLNYNPTVMPEGIRKLTIKALDATYKPSTTTNVETVRIDHAPPTIALSGTVTEQAKLGAELPKYTLAAEATDGVPGSTKDEDARSGVVKLTFEENGKYVVAPYEKACATQSCKLFQEVEVPASKMAPGSHTITVKAWDALGHEAKKSISFSTGDTQPPALSLTGLPGESAGSAYAAYWSSFGATGTSSGQFNHPAGIAIDSKGNLLVVDQNNKRVQKFNQDGVFVSSFGSSGTGNGQFSRPTDVAVDAAGNILVVDASNNRVQKFNQNGEFVSKFGSSGSGNGQFNGPESIAVDSKGNIWVADTYNGRLQKFDEQGVFVKVVATKGAGQGQLAEPTGIDIGPNDDVWVADWGNNRVTVFNKEGGFVRQFGTNGSANGQFSRPDAIEVDNASNVWVVDQSNSRIQKFNLAGEYVSKFGAGGSGKGQFSFGWPTGIASDSAGSIWIADTGNNRVQRWLAPNVTVAATLNTIDASATDAGFGVTSFSAKLTAADGTTEVLREASQACPAGKCALSLNLPEPDLSEKAEGVYLLTFSADDAAGNKGKVSKVIGLDPTPPTISLSGTLAAEANKPLGIPSAGLTIKADDPGGSGIREINVERDGRRVATFPYTCASNCGEVTASYRYSTARDGTERAIQKSSEPVGASLSKLTSVSCRSSADCTGVGYYVNSSGVTVPLAQRWDGTEWKVQMPPIPSGALETKLEDISCVSTSVCVAVGYYKTGSETFSTLVERLSGSTWSIQSSPNPAGMSKAYLTSVACLSTSDCWAVGKSAYKLIEELEGKKPTALIEHWNGSSWAISSLAEPPTQLTGVSCGATNSCVAVTGTEGYAVRRWNGTAWISDSAKAPPAGSGPSLVDVSCSSATECTAVGSYLVSGHTAPLAERWSGGSWSVQPLTDPFGVIEEGPSQWFVPQGKLEGVSCSSASSCTAFGFYRDASMVTQPLAESWDGTDWALQPTSSPVGSTNSVISEVSCASSFECTAVGFDAGSGTHALIESQAPNHEAHRITVEAVDKYGASAVKAIDVDVPAEIDETPECSQDTDVVAPKGTLSTTEALTQIESSLPQAVAPSIATTEEAAGLNIDPSYSPPQPNLEATGNLAKGETSVTPSGGVTLAGIACITPTVITTAATQAKVANGDAAIFANTAPKTETVVRPTAGGVSLVETITGSEAPDTLSWNVTVPVGMELEKLPSGAIAIVKALAEGEGEGVMPIPQPSDEQTPAALNDAGIQAETAAYQLATAQGETNHEVIAIIAQPWVVLRQEQIEPLLIELAPTEEIPTEYKITVYLPADEADAAFYPIHAHLEATASASGSTRCTSGSPCGQFNGEDAAKYAEFWANPSHPRNPHYADYGSNNCTNFVSQVIFAGRVRYMRAFEKGDGSWWYYNFGSGGVFGDGPSAGWEDTNSWRQSNELPRHLWQYGLAHIDKQEPWAWTRGTILGEDWYSTNGVGDINHVQFVVDTEDGASREPLIANNSSEGHNYPHRPWKFVKKSIEEAHGSEWNRIAIVMKHTIANLDAEKHDPDNLYGPNGLFRG